MHDDFFGFEDTRAEFREKSGGFSTGSVTVCCSGLLVELCGCWSVVVSCTLYFTADRLHEAVLCYMFNTV